MRLVRILVLVVAIAAMLGGLLVWFTGPADVQLGTFWHGYAPEGLNLTQAIVQRYVHPVVWTDVLVPVLLMPAAGVFFTIAVLALVLWLVLEWRRRRRS